MRTDVCKVSVQGELAPRLRQERGPSGGMEVEPGPLGAFGVPATPPLVFSKPLSVCLDGSPALGTKAFVFLGWIFGEGRHTCILCVGCLFKTVNWGAPSSFAAPSTSALSSLNPHSS